MAFLDPVLTPVMQPLLDASPFWALVILSLIITLLITLAYKYFTDQNEMKRLKDRLKEFQQSRKQLKSKPEELMKQQKEAMQVNAQYMKHSLKVTAITFLPIILIFGWMNAHLAYEPIFPGETYSVSAVLGEGVIGQIELLPETGTTLKDTAVQEVNSGKVLLLGSGFFGAAKEVPGNTWRLQSIAGEHTLTFKVGEQQQQKKIVITDDFIYEEPVSLYEHSDITHVQVNYKELQPLGDVSIFGWYPGWLGLYVIFSIVFSVALRKALKIY